MVPRTIQNCYLFVTQCTVCVCALAEYPSQAKGIVRYRICELFFLNKKAYDMRQQCISATTTTTWCNNKTQQINKCESTEKKIQYTKTSQEENEDIVFYIFIN